MPSFNHAALTALACFTVDASCVPSHVTANGDCVATDDDTASIDVNTEATHDARRTQRGADLMHHGCPYPLCARFASRDVWVSFLLLPRVLQVTNTGAEA